MITVNLYYTGQNGNAVKFAEEMEKLGMTYWKDGSYTKLDGNATFESCKYRKEFR